jgi:hypothetical protein
VEDHEPDSVKLDVSIPFETAKCSHCGTAGVGECTGCGREIAPPTTDGFAQARRKALRAASERAEYLSTQMREIRSGDVPLAPDQFLAAVEELEIGTILDDLDSVGKSFNGLDFGDGKVVGSDIRNAVDQHLDRLERLLEALSSLAHFRPAPPADELFAQIKECCCRSVDLASALLLLFRAPTYSDGAAASKHAQISWERFLEMDDLTAAKERVLSSGEEALNTRVELALGRAGNYVDESGSIDPGLVLISFASEGSPLDALAASLNRYFVGLLDGFALDPASSPGLVGPLALLAGTERPAAGHAVARLMTDALRAAHERDPDAVRSLAKRGNSEGPTIYAALSRVRRAFEALGDDSADEDAADRLLVSYRQIAETVFRASGWLAMDLEALARGAEVSNTSQPPMLGELRDRLNSGGALGRALAGGVDVGLRNAEAHVQYRWVPEREVVRDWRTEEEWDIARLLDSFHRLTAVVAGSDAALACFLSSRDLLSAADSLDPSSAPEVLPILATITFSSRGMDVQSVSRDGGTIVLGPTVEPDPSAVLPALAGYATFCRGPSQIRIEDPDGRGLAEVSASTLSLFAEAKPETKGLATTAVAFESAVRIGMDPQRADDDFLLLARKSIAVESMKELVDMELSPRAFRHLVNRLNYLRDLTLRPDFAIPISNPAAIRSELSKTRALVKRASQGQQSALKMLLNSLGEMCSEVDDVEAIWPPRGPR